MGRLAVLVTELRKDHFRSVILKVVCDPLFYFFESQWQFNFNFRELESGCLVHGAEGEGPK